MFKVSFFVFLFVSNLWILASPTETREWGATSGHSVVASALKVEGDQIILKKEDGAILKVPLKKFVESDQEILTKHFKIGELVPSSVALAMGLAHNQGEVVGPVDAGEGSSYYLYLPTTLKEGRSAPLLFCTRAGGWKKKALSRYKKTSELLGWVVAVSVESNNDSGFSNNVAVSKQAVAHILDTLPVDKRRVYFTGNSGGGSTSLANASEIKAEGAMPNVAYIPQGYKPKAKDYFVVGGGADFNRYASARARVEFGKKGVHRMHPGGHDAVPEWLVQEGLIWFQCRYLARNKDKHAEEVKDFEYRMLSWLEKDKPGEKSYYTYNICQLLMNDYQMEGDGKVKLSKLIDSLGEDSANVAYHQGISDLDQFSQDHLAKAKEGPSQDRSDPETSAAAKLMAGKYEGIPIIEDTFEAISGKTVKSKK